MAFITNKIILSMMINCNFTMLTFELIWNSTVSYEIFQQIKHIFTKFQRRACKLIPGREYTHLEEVGIVLGY